MVFVTCECGRTEFYPFTHWAVARDYGLPGNIKCCKCGGSFLTHSFTEENGPDAVCIYNKRGK